MNSLLLFTLFAGSMMITAAAWNADDPDMETSIQFTDAAWKYILKKAKEENKVVFVDIYASWCGPCKLLKRTTFNDEEVGAFFNSNFINATYNGEKGEGKELARLYQVRAYPTMLFINPDGSVKKVAVGYHNSNQLLRAAKGALQ
jgi:thiol:disulfide interchange protein